MSERSTGELLVNIGLCALGVVVLCLIPSQVVESSVMGIRPRLFVQISSIGLIVTGLLPVLGIMLRNRTSRLDRVDAGAAPTAGRPLTQATAVSILANLAIYVYAMELAGYLPSSIVCTAIFLLLLGERRFKTIAYASVLLPIAVYGLFAVLFKVQLPVGAWRR